MALRYSAKFGKQALLVTRFSDAGDTRRWVTQSPAIGDQHVLQDRGLDQPRTTCEIAFCDEPGAGSYLDRWEAFRALARGSSPQLFTHPINGAYEAVATELSYEVDSEERCVRASCTFVAFTDPEPVAAIGAGVVAPAGPEAVGVATGLATSALTAAGSSSSSPAAALAAVVAWAQLEDPDARAIALEAASIAASIDDEIERLELATHLERWPAYRALVNLRYSVVRAASTVTSETSRVTTITLAAAAPLLVICAQHYGARDAVDRARQVAKLNGLRTPGLVPAGTTLQLPAVSR